MVLPWLSLEAAITIPWSSPFFCIFIIVPTWVDFMFTIPPTLETSPIPTKENFADLETKKLSADRMRYLMHGVGVYDESAGELVGTDVVTRERFFSCFSFFFSEPVAFRRVYGLESYSRNSGNRTTTGLSATSRTPRYQLSHEDDYVVTRERAADDVRGVLRMLRESIGGEEAVTKPWLQRRPCCCWVQCIPQTPWAWRAQFPFQCLSNWNFMDFHFHDQVQNLSISKASCAQGKTTRMIMGIFPSNAFMASARSSNTFNCMLQTRVN